MKNNDDHNHNFLRIAAHEMRQPLLDIRNSVDKFRHFPERFKLGATLEKIEDAAGLALLNVDTALLLAQNEEELAKSLERSKQRIALPKFVRSIKQMLRGLCDDHNFKNDNIDISISNNLDFINVSKPLLAIVCVNAIGNSIKYSSQGFEKSWCSVRVRRIMKSELSWYNSEHIDPDQTEYMMISFTDNGSGIRPEMVDQVFEMGARAVGPHAIPGTGLGLYVMKRVVTAAGGSITIELGKQDDSSPHAFSTRLCVAIPIRETDG